MHYGAVLIVQGGVDVGEEVWETMLYFRSETARLAQEAQAFLDEAE
jgi:hypothetical protein